MPDCSKCHTLIPDDAKECPDCGAPLGPSNQNPEKRQTVHALLLNAHLMKLRGELEAAIGECIKALRINPDNVAAHSLLGDIYYEQGKTDEAMNWYKLALDLKPDSSVDRARLERLLSEKKTPISEETKPERKGWNKKALLAVIAVVVALIAVALIITEVIIPLTAQQPVSNVPAAPPVIENTPRTIMPRDTTGGDGNTPAASVAPVTGSYQETALATGLDSSQTLIDAKLRIVSILIDPRNGSVMITFVGPPLVAGQNTMEDVAKSSFIICKTAFLQNSTITRINVRALYSIPIDGKLQPEIVFTGDMSREKALSTDVESPNLPDMINIFENAWWHPQFR